MRQNRIQIYQEMKSDLFKCKRPSEVDRDGEQVEYDTVYVRNIELSDEPKPHQVRPIYAISVNGSDAKILRKVKGKTWGNLNKGDVVMDYGSIYDLGGDEGNLPLDCFNQSLKILQKV